MGPYPSITAEQKVVDGTVFAVSYHGVNAPLGIALVGVNDLFEELTIIYRSRGNLSGSYELLFRVNSSVGLVAQF